MKRILILISIIALIFTTGCWDMVEINQRLFPYSIGIDLNPGEGDPYIITISYPNIYSIGKNATQEDRVYVISTIATSLFQGANQLSTRLQYPFYLKHLRVVIFGEELSKNGHVVREILDGINRDYVINKKIRLLSAEGMARDVLMGALKAKRQQVIEGTLFSMLRNDKGTSRYTAQTLTDFIRDTDMGGVALMPRVAQHGEDLKVFGGGIFKNYQFIGHLGEPENRAVALIRGEVKEDLVDAPFNGTTLSYAITGAKVKRELTNKENSLGLKINIEVEGTLKEYIYEQYSVNRDDALVRKMEEAIAGVIKKEVDRTIKLLQKEFKADALGIGEYLYKFHPKLWKEVSQDWDEVFSDMDIEVAVKVHIRRRGLVE